MTLFPLPCPHSIIWHLTVEFSLVTRCYNLLFPFPLSLPPSLTWSYLHLAITSPPCHLITLSPHHPTISSPCHLTTALSPCYLDLTSTSPLPSSCLVLILVSPPSSSLTSISSRPCLISYLCIPLSIPFLEHCILPSLVPVLKISILILIYYLYSSFHLHPCSRPLVSPFILISTCSLILDHVLPVFSSHHGHPSLGSQISLYLCFLSRTCTAWSVLAFSLVLILSHM